MLYLCSINSPLAVKFFYSPTIMNLIVVFDSHGIYTEERGDERDKKNRYAITSVSQYNIYVQSSV